MGSMMVIPRLIWNRERNDGQLEVYIESYRLQSWELDEYNEFVQDMIAQGWVRRVGPVYDDSNDSIAGHHSKLRSGNYNKVTV